jgi:hypothetical protein
MIRIIIFLLIITGVFNLYIVGISLLSGNVQASYFIVFNNYILIPYLVYITFLIKKNEEKVKSYQSPVSTLTKIRNMVCLTTLLLLITNFFLS